ncbi:Thyroid hormone receptor interactor 12 [Aphelenchoides fujianensis]|nr:Thyroid hormone receptor interactor 12 [Aphelenchoides fujianensis]
MILLLHFLSQDKRCVESICSFFNRLIENMRFHPQRLRQIAGKNHELLQVFQQLLATQPLSISSGTFISLLKSLRYMCTSCGDLSVALFHLGFGRTLRFLLVGSEKKADQLSIEATNRPAQQLREIVDLIGELLPKLPSTGLFEVNVYLEQYTNPSAFLQNGRYKVGTTMWVYKDPATSDRMVDWKPFAPNEQLALERNRSMGVTTMPLEVNGELCEIDFSTMKRRVIATGAEVEIDRRPFSEYVESKDERENLRESSVDSFLDFIAAVFPLLVEIGSSSTCVNLRYDCVRVMLRMVYADIPLAAYISSTLSSSKNLALIALAIQLVGALLEKLPDLYMPLFEAEGVFFELKRKATMTPVKKTPVKSSHSQSPSSSRSKERHHQRRAADALAVDNSMLEGQAAAALGRLLQQQHTASQAAPLPVVDGQLPPSAAPTTAAASAAPSAIGVRAPAAPFPINSRGVLPNLFLSVGSLQGPLYQTLSNAVNNYAPPYGLNYSGPFSSTLDSAASTFSSAHSISSSTASSLKTAAAERLEKFIQLEAAALSAKCEAVAGGNTQSLENVAILTEIANLLAEAGMDVGVKPLHDLRDVLATRELSAFQVNYSGIIAALIGYLTENEGRLLPGRTERLRRFASVFMLLNNNTRPAGGEEHFLAFSRLISKIVLAVERLEQFSVRITNLSGNLSSLSGASMSSGGGGHSSQNFLREWRRGRGSIKVDPFTSISAIERYLMERGIGTTSQEDSSENEEVSDEDKEINSSPSSSFKGRIEILIGDNRLPSDMSILQAIRQYSLPQDDEDQETIPPSIWIAGHTLFYRARRAGGPEQLGAFEQQADRRLLEVHRHPPAGRRARRVLFVVVSQDAQPLEEVVRRRSRWLPEKKAKEDRKDKQLFNEGRLPPKTSLLDGYLRDSLDQPIDDPSERGLVLLRILYGLNTHWWHLFEDEPVPPTSHKPILAQSSFHSFKLNSKVSRQLSDFLTVATQQIPRWTKSLVRSVPFVFPFTTRRNFLYCTAFRTGPRPHAPVGTGFGPTMEFYSTLSREVQKHSLRLWHGTPIVLNEEGEAVEYTNGADGLYPVITRSPSSSRAWDSRSKRFEFIGRLMAQTLLDSRILDIPFATPFFKWILGQQESLGLADLELLEPTVYKSLREIGSMDASDLQDFEMYFTYPGNDSFELVKGGKHKALNAQNYRHFVELIAHWRLVEGVRADMEAVRRGFNLVVNSDHLSIFEANEMEGLFCGCSESADDANWDRNVLQQSIRPDHGYTHESQEIGWLLDMLFLQFVTGSPRLPVGGFRALHPPLTVVRKVANYGCANIELPSAMTCFNFLKLAPYADYETFVDRFRVALEHSYAFHLT